jgi:hypothetical protein
VSKGVTVVIAVGTLLLGLLVGYASGR